MFILGNAPIGPRDPSGLWGTSLGLFDGLGSAVDLRSKGPGFSVCFSPDVGVGGHWNVDLAKACCIKNAMDEAKRGAGPSA
jgi:hypothetical protein